MKIENQSLLIIKNLKTTERKVLGKNWKRLQHLYFFRSIDVKQIKEEKIYWEVIFFIFLC